MFFSWSDWTYVSAGRKTTDIKRHCHHLRLSTWTGLATVVLASIAPLRQRSSGFSAGILVHKCVSSPLFLFISARTHGCLHFRFNPAVLCFVAQPEIVPAWPLGALSCGPCVPLAYAHHRGVWGGIFVGEGNWCLFCRHFLAFPYSGTARYPRSLVRCLPQI